MKKRLEASTIRFYRWILWREHLGNEEVLKAFISKIIKRTVEMSGSYYEDRRLGKLNTH